MTITEMTEVMEAFENGEKIQCCDKGISGDWCDTENPVWDFSSYDYRIKPENKEKAYAVTNEMIEDFKKRFSVKDWPNHSMPLIWLRENCTGYEYLVEGYGLDCVIIEGRRKNLHTIFDNYTYLDGSIVGIVEGEA